MSEDLEFGFDWTPTGRQGEGILTVRPPDGEPYIRKLDITRTGARTKAAEDVHARYPAVAEGEALAELEQLAASSIAHLQDMDDPEGQAELLLGIVAELEVELFHDPGGHDADAYASFQAGEHRETWAVWSKGFRRWLLNEFLVRHAKAPNDQALKSALATIDAKASFQGEEHEVFVRVAGGDGVIWLDLGDETWRAIRVDRHGYKIVDSQSVEVRFTRPSGMRPLPVPQDGGSLDKLRDLLNLSSDDDWVLLLGWLVMALHPFGDHPILAVNGEEGSAKTTLCRLVAAIVDPNKAGLRRPPREERDLVIAAVRTWVIGFDNLSGLSQPLSDAVCCLSTGSAFSARKLYTDQEETLITVKRPVILNGIPDLLTRGDLTSRSIPLTLETIPPEKRRTRKAVEQGFKQIHPGVLGALLNAVSCALRRQDEVELPGMTRMADLCEWVTAAEPALGLNPGTFVATYERRINESVDAVIDSAAIGAGLLTLLEGSSEPWVGTATELLVALDEERGDGRRPRGWPDSAQKVSNDIRRLAPSLRKKGIAVVVPRKGDNPRQYRIGPLPDSMVGGQPGQVSGQARESAGNTPPDVPEKSDSRAPALPALDCTTPGAEGEDEGLAAQDREFGWVD